MKSVDTITVRYHGREVGTLAMLSDCRIAFAYTEEWLENGFSISPFSLPLKPGVFTGGKSHFGNLYGVFADSLPDAWGQLLVARLLRRNGIDAGEITPLDRLAIVGDSGFGALTYEPVWNAEQAGAGAAFDSASDLDWLADECRKLLLSQDSNALDTLFMLGGSSGGARPKITVEIDGMPWLIKFPAHTDLPDSGVMEYEYSCCARRCGILMPETKVFASDRCSGYYGVRRFDYEAGERKHMLTAAAMLEADFRSPCLDYTELMKLTKLVGRNSKAELEQMYRRMCFNVYAHNRDDHAKNFTWIYHEADDVFRLSPAYDLTYSSTFFGEHTTSVHGNGRNPGSEELIRVGTEAGLGRKLCKEIDEEIHAFIAQDLEKWLRAGK